MTELDYIRVSHLARVRAMQNLLRDLITGVDDVIELAAVRAVGEVLSTWDEELTERIRIKEPEDTDG